MDHVILNINSNMFMVAAFLDIERAFDIAWHPDLLNKLHKLKFWMNFIKLISSFLSELKFLLKTECPYLEKYKQGCLKVPSCPQHCTVYV
jgi:hypothetical protein